MKTIISRTTHKGARDYQEDRIFAASSDKGLLLAVFDGHGGDETSQRCLDILPEAFAAVIDNPSLPFLNDKMWGMFDFLRIRTDRDESGTTASIVYLPASLDTAVVGVLGDSPVVIRTGEGIIQTRGVHKGGPNGGVATKNEYWKSPEHNVRSNPEEVKRVKAAGGTVFGGYAFPATAGLSSSRLQLSRTLGDSYFSSFLSREPEIFEVPIGVGSFVLLASDGVLDPSHESSAAYDEIIGLVGEKGVSDDLVAHAVFTTHTGDNASAILVRIIE